MTKSVEAISLNDEKELKVSCIPYSDIFEIIWVLSKSSVDKEGFEFTNLYSEVRDFLSNSEVQIFLCENFSCSNVLLGRVAFSSISFANLTGTSCIVGTDLHCFCSRKS